MLTLATLNAKVLLCGILNAIILIWKHSPAGIHLLKVSNRNTTTMPLASFWCLYCQRWTNFFSMIFLWLLREIGYCWVCMSPSNQKYKFKFISCMYVYWGYYLHQTSATSLVENSDKYREPSKPLKLVWNMNDSETTQINWLVSTSWGTLVINGFIFSNL